VQQHERRTAVTSPVEEMELQAIDDDIAVHRT
jgi:hypothetical protein